MKKILALLLLPLLLLLSGCPNDTSADARQAAQQEVLIQEATSQTGMPAIKNFRERKLLKMIYELRDQDGLVTYTYLVSQSGKPELLCASVGYAISDATGYTNPDKLVRDNGQSFGTMTQAEPNGLYTPPHSESNWVMCIDPKTGMAQPALVSARIVVLPYKL